MAILCNGGRVLLWAQVSEDEAILLGLWRDFSLEGADTSARATLALPAANDSVAPIANAAGPMTYQESPE